MRPMDLGAAPNDEEMQPLTANAKESDLASALRESRRQMVCAVMIAVLFACGVLTGLGVLIWRVNSNMDAMENAIRPHAHQIVNATVDMMHDLGGSFHNMHEISEYTNQLVEATAGTTGPAANAINSSAIIAAKLAEFMAHPTISVSLGGLGG